MSKKEKLLASAQKNLQKGQVPRAIKDYQQLVQIDSADVRLRQKLAELLGRDRRVEEAVGEYETVAKHYTKTGFYLKAIAVYKQMQKLDPTKSEISLHLAELNEKQGLVGNALAEYRNLVAYYEKHKMLSEAVNVLQRMRELEPDNLNILIKIAETYAKTGLKDKALEEFEKVLAVLRQKEDFARVAKLYEIFLPLYPDVPSMKRGLAQTLIQKGEAEKGVKLLKDLLQETPEEPEILRILARGYRAAGDHGNERLTYQHLLRHSGEDLDLRRGYIQACIDAGKGKKALDDLEEWKENFHQAGRASELKGFYEQLRQVFPRDNRIRTLLQSFQDNNGEKSAFQLDTAITLSGLEGPSSDASKAQELDEPVESILGEASGGPEGISAQTGEKKSFVPTEKRKAADDHEEIPLEFLEGVGGIEPDEAVTDRVESEELETPAEAPPEETVQVEPELELELELDLDSDEPLGDQEISFADAESVLERRIESVLSLEKQGPEQPSAPEDVVAPEEEILDLEPGDVLAPEDVDEPEEDILDLEMEDALLPGEPIDSSATDLRGELEEAEFYLQQGLLEDAERICRHLLKTQPDRAEIRDKLAEVETRRQTLPLEPEAERHFDLAGEISDEILSEFEEGIGGFADSQKGIETPIDVEDVESHYNLGIAYKEMGLLDEAVAEFDKAMTNAARRLDCLTLKGICLLEKGAFEEAEEAFKTALGHPGLSDGERVSLLYEMGLLYESWGRPLDALDSFQSVADTDLFFRDVSGKIQSLRKELGLENSEDGGESGPTGDKDRVSYV